MGSAATDALVAELQGVLTTLEPQIRGLEDLAKVSLSGETRAPVLEQITTHRRRRDYCKGVLDAIKALTDDGYPAEMKKDLMQEEFEELEVQMADFQAAFGEFKEVPVASNVAVSVGPFTNNP